MRKEPPFPGNGSEKPFAKEKAELATLAKELEAKDFYSRLEIDRLASEDEIRKSLRKFSKFHPGDKPPELQEQHTQIFQLYTEAVATLRNAAERRKYDAQLAGSTKGSFRSDQAPGNESKASNPPRYERSWYADSNQKQAALQDVLVGIYFGVSWFVNRRNSWVSKGIVTKEEIDRDPQVKDLVIENILNGLPVGAKEFADRRDSWVREGIVAKEEINSNSAVRRHALNNLQFSSSEEMLKERLSQWKQVDVLTDADAAGIRL